MTKATLEFDLDDPEQKQSLERALKSQDLVLVLSQLDNHLRSYEKYDNQPMLTRELFHRILGEYDICINNLIS